MPGRIMKNNILFLLILFLTSYFYLPGSASAVSQTITITENGYIPDLITIEKNDKIIFKNEDKVDHWPASDLHPTHLIYPAFDPKIALKSGQSWEFKFDKAGKWRFHDHLYPHQKGDITVNGQKNESLLSVIFYKIRYFFNGLFSFSDDKAILNQKLKLLPESEKFKFIESYSKEFGVEKAWEKLELEYSDASGASSPGAHDLAHIVGGLIFESKGLNGISICKSTFAFGCYHGLLDKAFLNSLEKLPDAQDSCSKLSSSGPVSSCIHGIGHGIASFNKSKNLEKSLKDCDRLSMGQEYCYDGVFMEFERSSPKDFYSSDSPLSPCDNLGAKFAISCGRNQVRVMQDRFGFEFTKISQTCLTSKETAFKDACFDALGFYAFQVSQNDPAKVVTECKLITHPDYKGRCFSAAAGEMVFQNAPNWQTNSIKVCNSLKSNYKTACLEKVEQIKNDYGRK